VGTAHQPYVSDIHSWVALGAETAQVDI